jgi:thioredoxin-like negative regulator of GroEL
VRNRLLFAGLLIALIIAAANLSFADDAASKSTYANAYKVTQDSGKPLVVLIGADWCPYCQVMKTSVMPQVAAHGDLQNVSYAYVNSDQQNELAGKLLSGKSIPQMVMYEKTADGWKQTRLIGGQSAEAVEGFLGAAKSAVATQKPTTGSQAAASAAAVMTGKTAGS